jgi:hypothetical protein
MHDNTHTVQNLIPLHADMCFCDTGNVSGLQDFSPEPKTYDLIWCQWVLGHLTDEDLIDFLKSCKYVLNVYVNALPRNLAIFSPCPKNSFRG